jgi:hypothetical protein
MEQIMINNQFMRDFVSSRQQQTQPQEQLIQQPQQEDTGVPEYKENIALKKYNESKLNQPPKESFNNKEDTMQSKFNYKQGIMEAATQGRPKPPSSIAESFTQEEKDLMATYLKQNRDAGPHELAAVVQGARQMVNNI